MLNRISHHIWLIFYLNKWESDKNDFENVYISPVVVFILILSYKNRFWREHLSTSKMLFPFPFQESTGKTTLEEERCSTNTLFNFPSVNFCTERLVLSP